MNKKNVLAPSQRHWAKVEHCHQTPTLWAQGVPQQLATTSMAPRRGILLVRFELIASRSLC
jgi:hypothetical protein